MANSAVPTYTELLKITGFVEANVGVSGAAETICEVYFSWYGDVQDDMEVGFLQVQDSEQEQALSLKQRANGS